MRTTLAVIAFACSLACGCTIEDELSKEQLVNLKATDLESQKDRFSKLTLACIKGDLSSLEEIMSMYMTSARSMQTKNGMELLKLENNKNFEKCALKAMNDGDSRAFELIIRNPNLSAHISRYFYKNSNLRDGAYWAARVVNIQGQADGYETLGSIFIKDKKTIAIGASMLEHSVRLGNYNALSVLRMASMQYNDEYFKNKEKKLKKIRQLNSKKQAAPES